MTPDLLCSLLLLSFKAFLLISLSSDLHSTTYPSLIMKGCQRASEEEKSLRAHTNAVASAPNPQGRSNSSSSSWLKPPATPSLFPFSSPKASTRSTSSGSLAVNISVPSEPPLVADSTPPPLLSAVGSKKLKFGGIVALHKSRSFGELTPAELRESGNWKGKEMKRKLLLEDLEPHPHRRSPDGPAGTPGHGVQNETLFLVKLLERTDLLIRRQARFSLGRTAGLVAIESVHDTGYGTTEPISDATPVASSSWSSVSVASSASLKAPKASRSRPPLHPGVWRKEEVSAAGVLGSWAKGVWKWLAGYGGGVGGQVATAKGSVEKSGEGLGDDEVGSGIGESVGAEGDC
ncbi:hypothetical protein BC829DRAFT_432621 [Chytridium lagenaria]|nr:hypothetical protein BC829DRAFT_432621 [Chytridium lagenaria]